MVSDTVLALIRFDQWYLSRSNAMTEPELEYQVCDNYGRIVAAGYATKPEALAKCQQLQINAPHGSLVPRQYFVVRGVKQCEVNLNNFFKKEE